MKKRARRTAFRGLYLLLVPALVLGAIEAASWGIYAFNHGESLPRRQLQERLDALGRLDASEQQSAERNPTLMGSHILHPFIGFVRNPKGKYEAFNNLQVDATVNEYGFFGPTPIHRRSADKAVVGITGGSVAMELFLYSRETLRQALEEASVFPGKEIEIVSFGLEGMKQPQQLFALTYLLSLGAHFDLVINFDGFNEVTLPLVDNQPFGVASHYPRAWRVYASKGLDVKGTLLAGKKAVIRQQRQEWAMRISQSLLRHSSLVLMLWESYERRVQAEILSLDGEMRWELTIGSSALSPQVTGPPESHGSQLDRRVHAVELWKNASVQLARLCNANDILYFHFLQPNQHHRDSKPLSEEEESIAMIGDGADLYRRHAEAGYPLLVREGSDLASEGVRFFDLSMLFKGETKTLYRDDCCHYNEAGYEMVAREVANRISSRAGQGEDEQ